MLSFSLVAEALTFVPNFLLESVNGGFDVGVLCVIVQPPKLFCLFKDVEKKMELKSSETPHPSEPGHCYDPHPQNAGISILPAPNLTQPCG